MVRSAEFLVRPMAAAEAEAVAALIRAAFAQQSVATDPPPSALRETAPSVAASIQAGGGVVAMAGDALIGAVLWEPRGEELYLGRLAVAPGWRGVARIVLSTRLVLLDNRRLFAACGFRETAQHTHPGYAHPTFVDMRKDLA